MRLLSAVVSALALAACISPAPLGERSPSAPTTSAAEVATPSGRSASPSALSVPSGPFVVGTAQGGVYALQPSGLGERIFDCGKRSVARLERSPDGRRLFVLCSDAAANGEGYVWQSGSQARAIPAALIPYAAAWSPDSRSLALLVPGTCTPTAPVCASRIVSYEIASGTVTTLHNDDVLMENLRWTPGGLTYYRRGSPGGTFVLEGSTWRRIANDPIVAVAADGRLMLDRAAYDTGRERHAVVLVTGTTETVLTATSDSERGLAFGTAGRVVARREDLIGNSSIVVYEAGRATSITAGEFGANAIEWNSWLIALTYSNTVAFYSLDARQFASTAVRVTEAATAIALRPQ